MRTKKELNAQIGRRIRGVRETHRYTQAQFAEKIDVSTQFVSDVERGVVGISCETLLRICTTFHISADTLILGEVPAPSLMGIMYKLQSLNPEQRKAVDTVIDGLLMLIPQKTD